MHLFCHCFHFAFIYRRLPPGWCVFVCVSLISFCVCNTCNLVRSIPHSQDPLEYFNREHQKRREEETNLWSEPGDPSHSERDDDRVLYGLLQARTKTRMGSTVREGGLSGQESVKALFTLTDLRAGQKKHSSGKQPRVVMLCAGTHRLNLFTQGPKTKNIFMMNHHTCESGE